MTIFVRGGTVSVPDLKGTSQAVARHKLRAQGLEMQVREERWSNSVPYGVVIEQGTDAGVTLKRGRSIAAVISLGTRSVAVPQLGGMASARQARLLLEQNGLGQGVLDEVHSGLPQGTVLAQSPESGVEVSRGDAISLLVSKGPRPVARVMPNLKGSTLEEARTLVRQAGLVLRHVTEVPGKGLTAGTVLSQSLPAGMPAVEGEDIALNVAQGAESLVSARLAILEFTLPAEGVQERRVTIRVTDARGEKLVHNAMEKPGKKLKMDVRVSGPASYRVEVSGQVAEEKEIP